MNTIIQKQGLASNDLHHVAYIRHMAQTTRSEPAKRAFELFLKQQNQRWLAFGSHL